jgi:hypothetical protein
MKGDFTMRLTYLALCAGLCAVPLCAGAGVFSVASKSVAVVERAAKGNRTLVPFHVGNPGVYVEIAEQPKTAVTVRDRDGSMIYRIDPANLTTTVAKRTGRDAISRGEHTSQRGNPVNLMPLPDGCESAFSPYADPDKALVIGRCIS